MPGLSRGAQSRIVVIPAIDLLIELYCRVSAGAFAWYLLLSFGACGKQTGSRFFLICGNRFRNGNRFWEAFFALISLPIFVSGTAPRQLLFALPEPDQTALLPHCVQDTDDGVVLDLDVFS